ncbi:MAG: hypothetical protein JSU82_00930 [Rhodospirillales bacterium]|nr:MAG: hypothetical protein JSU82_00930 [Rhodospirillales bacterium]
MKTLFFSLIMAVAPAAAAFGAPGTALPAPEDPHGAAIVVSQTGLPNSGEVTEVLAAGSYTYLHVAKDGKETWLAIPRRDVSVGAQIRYPDGLLMADFHSGSLNRTFEEVVFLSGVEVVGEEAPAMPAGHPPVSAAPSGAAEAAPAMPAGHPAVAGSAGQAANLPNAGKVTEVIAAGQYTYLQVTRDDGEGWIAVPRREIAVGSEVRYGNGAVMRDFHSASLNRTFDEVLFLGGVVVTTE